MAKLTYNPRKRTTGKKVRYSVKPKGKRTPLVGVFAELSIPKSQSSADKKRKALPAGKRISKATGKPYYESRANRSDKITNAKRTNINR